jgi:hypothetical protein
MLSHQEMSSSAMDFSSLPPGAPPAMKMQLFNSTYEQAKMINAIENGTLPPSLTQPSPFLPTKQNQVMSLFWKK